MRGLALAGCLLAALAAGCGGDAGGDQRREGLTRTEFVSRLDRICADFKDRQDEIGEPESLQAIAELGPEVQSEFDDAVQRVRDLGEPPEEIAAQVERFLEIAGEQRRLLGELVDAAEQNDLERAAEVADEGELLNEEANALATELGAERCAED